MVPANIVTADDFVEATQAILHGAMPQQVRDTAAMLRNELPEDAAKSLVALARSLAA
jgi:hypothetical protein